MLTKKALDVDIAPEGKLRIKFATLGQVDRTGDIIKAGAIGEQLGVPFMRFNHDRVNPPIGVGTAKEDGDAAIWDGKLFLKMTPAAETYESLKGLQDEAEFSWAFAGEHTPRPGGRIFSRTTIFETCQVFRGAGHDTGVLSIEKSDLQIRSRLMASEIRLQESEDKYEELKSQHDALLFKYRAAIIAR